jgi:hypothetical protein
MKALIMSATMTFFGCAVSTPLETPRVPEVLSVSQGRVVHEDERHSSSSSSPSSSRVDPTAVEVSCEQALDRAIEYDPQLRAFDADLKEWRRYTDRWVLPKAPQLRGRLDPSGDGGGARAGLRLYLPSGLDVEHSARKSESIALDWRRAEGLLETRSIVIELHLQIRLALADLWLAEWMETLSARALNLSRSLVESGVISQATLDHRAIKYSLSVAQEIEAQAQLKDHLTELGALIGHPRLDRVIGVCPLSRPSTLSSVSPRAHIIRAEAQALSLRARSRGTLSWEFLDLEWDETADGDRALISVGVNLPWRDESAARDLLEAHRARRQAEALAQQARRASDFNDLRASNAAQTLSALEQRVYADSLTHEMYRSLDDKMSQTENKKSRGSVKAPLRRLSVEALQYDEVSRYQLSAILAHKTYISRLKAESLRTLK